MICRFTHPTTSDAPTKSATFWVSTPAAPFSSASPSGSRESGMETKKAAEPLRFSYSSAFQICASIAYRKSIRPVAKNFHDAQYAAAPVTIRREGECPPFPVENQFYGMRGNVRIVGFKFDVLRRLGEAIQHDSDRKSTR